ncbi:GNAT family N-acetyltransferase [Paenibacillus sp. FSL W8-0426]|uniref:GNAT family N-acetyltransferase n=1 Tax=Paenibacillus sp. FSL W8-0426 TaxID=2921714 RepID=UPI0030D731ED
MSLIHIVPVTKDNWEEAMNISVYENQKEFVPSIVESLAFAYIKPWDEAFDPYTLFCEGQMVGFYYLSYTPESRDNYWIGGFQLDQRHQGKGLGKIALNEMIRFIKETHPKCELISLTVEKKNEHARRLYERAGFVSQQKENEFGEIIYQLSLKESTF